MLWSADFGLQLSYADEHQELQWRSFGRQLTLDFFETSPDEHLREAMRDWSCYLSPRVAEVLSIAPRYGFELYTLLCRAPQDVVELAADLPTLAVWLARHQMTQSEALWEAGRSPKRRELLEILGLPPQRWLVRAIAKLPSCSIAWNGLQALRELVATPRRLTAWRHCRVQLSAAATALLLCRTHVTLLSAQLLEEVSSSHLCPARSLQTRLRIFDRNARSLVEEGTPVVLTSLRQLIEIDTRTTASASGSSVLPADVHFPPPRLPGIPREIEPIRTRQALVQEGEDMGHCVGSYSERVEDGSHDVYRILSPERGTLSISYRNDEVEAVKLKGRFNEPLSRNTRCHVLDHIGLRPAVSPSLGPLAPLFSLPSLESFQLGIGNGTGALSGFQLSDSLVMGFCARYSGKWLDLYDDASFVSPKARIWGDAQLPHGLYFREPKACSDDEDEGVDFCDQQDAVTLHNRGDISVHRYRGSRIWLRGAMSNDATWVRDVTVHDAYKIRIVSAEGAHVTGAFLSHLGVESLARLNLEGCLDLRIKCLLAAPLTNVWTLSLRGTRLPDAAVADLLRRWQPRRVDLSFRNYLGRLTLEMLAKLECSVTLGGFSMTPDHVSRLWRSNWLKLHRTLKLTDVIIDSEAFAALVTNLKKLTLSDCRLLGDWPERLKAADLTELLIDGCGAVDEHVIEGIASQRSLTSLTLIGEQVGRSASVPRTNQPPHVLPRPANFSIYCDNL